MNRFKSGRDSLPHPLRPQIDYLATYDGHHRALAIENGTSSTHNGTSRYTLLAGFDSTYDLAGNRLDSTGSGHPKQRAADYTYDTLHRVTKADYSTPSGVSTSFSYDLLGNRAQVVDTLNGQTTEYQTNIANEYTTITESNPYGYEDITHDARGNLLTDEGFQAADNTEYFDYAYDADNRLSRVRYDDGSGLDTQAEYVYDALGRRVAYKRYDTAGNLVETLYYLHDGQNMVAELTYDDETLDLQRSYVHGLQYIDERVLLFDATDGVNGRDHYYLLGELYSVAGLAGSQGAIEEVVVYDTYGQATIWHWPSSDVNVVNGQVNGMVDIFDMLFVRAHLGGGNFDPRADVEGPNGDVTIFDELYCRQQLSTSAVEVNYSGLGNPYLFTGRLTDTLHADSWYAATDPTILRLQDNRNRTYSPKHGRWLQRDPLEYVDGMSLYQYVRSTPINHGDPLGMCAPDEYWSPSANMCLPLPTAPRYQPTLRDLTLSALNEYSASVSQYYYYSVLGISNAMFSSIQGLVNIACWIPGQKNALLYNNRLNPFTGRLLYPPSIMVRFPGISAYGVFHEGVHAHHYYSHPAVFDNPRLDEGIANYSEIVLFTSSQLGILEDRIHARSGNLETLQSDWKSFWEHAGGLGMDLSDEATPDNEGYVALVLAWTHVRGARETLGLSMSCPKLAHTYNLMLSRMPAPWNCYRFVCNSWNATYPNDFGGGSKYCTIKASVNEAFMDTEY